MGYEDFVPEVWHAEVQENLLDSHVFANLATTKYQGDITRGGDTVRIKTVGRPTVRTYTGSNTRETVQGSTQALLVDQEKYFDFAIDDITLFQSGTGASDMAATAKEGAYALAETADQFMAAKYTQVASGNQLGTVSITTSALATDMIADLNQQLNEASVPRRDRWVVIPPFVENLLIQGLSKVNEAGTTESLRDAMVGRLYGFDIYSSNNCVNVTGDDWAVLAGYPGAWAYAESIVKTVSYQPEGSFDDALKTLHVYGAKVTQPAGLASCVASIT